LTDLIQNPKLSAGMRRRLYTSFYTGPLIKSYIQFHLTPRWNPLKTISNTYKSQQFLNPTRTTFTMLKKSYFSTPCTPRNPIKE